MDSLKNNSDKNNMIINYIKNVVLKTYPISSREEVLFNHPSPKMDINIWFFNDELDNESCEIQFVCGSTKYRSSLPNRLDLESLISPRVLFDLIDFLLNDNRIITNIYKNSSLIGLKFKVNLCKDAMIGITCDEITLNLDFVRVINNANLLDYYFKLIVCKYFDVIKDTEFYKNLFETYSANLKNDFVNFLNDEEFKSFLKLFSKDDLKELINNVPNERFDELYQEYIEKTCVLKLNNNGS